MRMAADRFDACPLNVQNALRARLITVFSARYLSVQKDRNHQKISARSNFSSMESRLKRAHMSRHGQSRCCRFHLPWVPGTLQARARQIGSAFARFAAALQGLQTTARR